MIAQTSIKPERVYHPYIEKVPDVCGGKAVVVGTRIKVTQIVIEYERLGWTPDQIVDAHPHLVLAHVHDALSYYYENQAELDAEMREEETVIREMKQQYHVKSA
jgi:uncharacterized protein (DUF433 family)